MKEKYIKYAELKVAIKDLETQAKELNEEILADMMNREVMEVEIVESGKLVVKSRRNWIYTPQTTSIGDMLKEKKKAEEQTGEATYSEKFYVQFNPLKSK